MYECTRCDEGYYCDEEGLATIDDRECPTGHYCPRGTADPYQCLPGTYQPQKGSSEEEDCLPCPAGGYCPAGTSTPVDCLPGFECLPESPTMSTCAGGHYCNSETNYQKKECPPNFYCPRGSAQPIPCDSKHTCENYGTEEQQVCGPGNYVVDNSRFGAPNRCDPCPAGTYSSHHILDGCAPCVAGYVCTGATNTDYPTLKDDHGGYLCPKGSYCPEGSAVEEKCPPGTYNPVEGAKTQEECRLCAAGTFAANWGSVGCKPCGQFAGSVEGSALCTCKG